MQAARGENMVSQKGQSEIMEYVLMVLFIVASVIAIILFLTWWNTQQLQMQGSQDRADSIVSLAQHLQADYMFISQDSMFDDSKLTSIGTDACARLQQLFGEGWYARIKSLDMEGDVPCTCEN